MQPTGQGLTLNGWDVAGTEGIPLPPRTERSNANDAARLPGITMPADNAADGDIDMKGTEPWR